MVNGSIITNEGKKIFLDRTYNATATYTAPSLFKLGISETTPSVADTSLTREVPISGTETVDDCEATTGWSGGTDSAVSLNSTTYKIGSGSLNIYKSGTTGTVFSASKTTTSVDFTSKDLHTWLYITDLTDLVSTGTAVTIRFGSDSSNYYYLDTTIGSLAAGWNLIVFNSSGATGSAGSPTITACDYYYIALNTDLAADTVAEGDVVIDDLKVASTDDYVKTFETGYPTINESTLEATTKCRVSTTEANGYNINALGLFNNDATKKMFSKFVFASESKETTDEIIFTIKDRII